MSFAKRLNRPTFNIDTTDFTYTKLSEVFNSKSNGGEDTVHKIDGVFINTSQYGDNPVAINVEHKQLINLPKHTATSIRDILEDSELVECIKDGKAGFTIYEYESHNKKCYSINFVDL